jgi:hypothetical protein
MHAASSSLSFESSGSSTTLAVARLPAESGPIDAPLPKQVSSVNADRIQHIGTFISLYLPRADGPALPPPSALMLGLPSMQANSQVLLAAVDALSAAQLAVDHRNHLLINRSRSLYGTALSQMLQAIQDPVTALQDETLLSTYLLTLYEVCNIFFEGSAKLTSCLGFRGCHAGPRILLSCPRTVAPAEAARAGIVPKQAEHADFPRHTIQLSMIYDLHIHSSG